MEDLFPATGLADAVAINDKLQVISQTSIATVQFTATLPATAAPVIATTRSGQSIPVTLLGTDPQGGTLTYAVATPPAHGTLSGVAPALTYVSAADFVGTDVFTYTAANAKGVSDPATVTITVQPLDVTPPVIAPTITGTLNATTGWYTSDVTLSWSVTDPDSPISNKTGCTDVALTTNQAALSYSCTATSLGGTAPVQTVTIKIDKTVPTVSGKVTSGTKGANDWYVSDVGVTWTPSAEGPSGQTLSSECKAATLTTDKASHTFGCTVTTGAGLTSDRGTVTVKRDARTPTIADALTGTLSPTGWYTSNVGITWTTTAGPSGVNTCTSAPATVDGLTISFTCTATAGNGKAASLTTPPVKRDATLPVVTYGAHSALYTVDQAVSISCTATDNLSGVASSSCAPIAGDAYTFAIGANTFTATATDNAGNVGTASTSFTVLVTSASLCQLARRWVRGGNAGDLCQKLAAGQWSEFVHNVTDNVPDEVTAAHAKILVDLVKVLGPVTLPAPRGGDNRGTQGGGSSDLK